MTHKPIPRKLNEEQLDTALMVLAEHGGNSSKAAKHLREMWGDAAPNDSTLRNWRNYIYAERYLDLAAGIEQARKDKRVIQGFREIVLQSQDKIASALNSIDVDKLEQKDLAKTAQQLAVTAGIASEKTLLYEGRPTQITETRNPDWFTEQLRALGVDVEEEEIPDVELVGDEPREIPEQSG